MYTNKEVIEANIELHTKLARYYKSSEPHYKPENVKRVREILVSLKNKTGGKSLLDIGCGMGFIIDIAKDMFEIIRGIDITQSMLDKVNKKASFSDIDLKLANSEKIPFEDNTFDVCTANALLHHLHTISPTLEEVYRVLKPGGVFYSDLDPNYYFWKTMMELPLNNHYSDIILREVNAVRKKDEELEKDFNVKKDILLKAEHLKHIQGGFKEEEVLKTLKEVGFSSAKIKYEWFLGEGNIIHNEGTAFAVEVMRNYLRSILPLSRHLFKYVSFYAIK